MFLLDLDADLIPGVAAAGLSIGQPVTELLRLGSPDAIEPRIGCRVLKYGPVWVFEAEAGVVMQVCVRAGYRGKLAGKIGVGSRVSEVEAAFGPLEYVGAGEYQIAKGTPWLANNWLFSVGRGIPAMNEPGWQDAPVECVCIGSSG